MPDGVPSLHIIGTVMAPRPCHEPVLKIYSNRLTIIAAFSLLCMASCLRAQNTTWSIPASANWDVPGNWSSGLPGLEIAYTYINNGGTALLPAYISGTYNQLSIGFANGGVGAINISGGNLSGGGYRLAEGAGSSASITITSGTLSSVGESHVGFTGTGSLQIQGGLTSQTSNLVLGYQTTGNGTVTVASGTLAINYSSPIAVGFSGTGNLIINNGGLVTGNSSITLGYLSTGHGSLTVTGHGSVVRLNGGLRVGHEGSNNTATIADGALVQLGTGGYETIDFSNLGGTNNLLRLDGGYLALGGNETAYVGDLIGNGYIQLWDGSAWVTATAEKVEVTYYATNAEGEAATGYSGLGGYTVLTTVPEPGTATLILLGLGSTLLRRKRREFSGRSAAPSKADFPETPQTP